MATLGPVPRENTVVGGFFINQRWFDWFNAVRDRLLELVGGVRSGTGDPNGSVVGSVGDLWRRTDGGAGTTLYVKESGTNTTAGWVGK